MALSDEMLTDLSEIFSTSEFGKTATWKFDGSGAGVSVTGHFVNEFEAVQLGLVVEGSHPIWLGRTSELSNATHASTLTVSGTVYYVIGIQPYTELITKLILSLNPN